MKKWILKILKIEPPEVKTGREAGEKSLKQKVLKKYDYNSIPLNQKIFLESVGKN